MLIPKIFRAGPDKRNFGDELNLWMWDKYIPSDAFDRNDGQLLGIGTMIGKDITPERPLVIFGSGAGYSPIPDLSGADVRFVRGPRTAAAIGESVKWITDPAILIADGHSDYQKVYDVSFMPHWVTAESDATLRDAASLAGINLILPSEPIDTVVRKIGQSRLLVTEALHGAVAADSLRVPWIPVYFQRGHIFKWFDWCCSMGIRYDPVDLTVYSLEFASRRRPQLSNWITFKMALRAVKEEMYRLRDDIINGRIRGSSR